MKGNHQISPLVGFWLVFAAFALLPGAGWAKAPGGPHAGSAGHSPKLVLAPGLSVENVQRWARYYVADEGKELTIAGAIGKYGSGSFSSRLDPTHADAMHDWRVWIAVPFEAPTSAKATIRRTIGLGGVFVRLPRVYLDCEGAKPSEILASVAGSGHPLSARYFTYVRTQSFALAPGQSCLALINVASTDNPDIGIFREGELGTNQVAAVLFKGGFSATLLIIGLVLALVSYLTDRPLGVLIGIAYSVAMVQNEASLFTTTFIASPQLARSIWEGITVLTIFLVVLTFLYGFRKELHIKGKAPLALIALALVIPIAIIAYNSNSTPDIIWALYLGLFLFALTVMLKFDIARRLRLAAGGVLILSSLAALYVEPYYLGRYLSDLTIEFIRDSIRLIAGVSVLLLLLVDVLRSRRERSRLIEERIAALESQSAADKALLQKERDYARARDLAQRRKAQLAAASHDIRQPLIGLRAALRSEAGNISAALAERLDEAIGYLESLTNQFSDRKARENRAGDEEVYSLVLIASAVEKMFAGEAEERGIAFSVSGGDCRTAIPALALIRATSNLVANALRHSRASHVSLEVECSDTCRITVSDDGRGMDAASLENALRAGGRSPQSDGEGLGLAIIADLAERHGFDFSIESAPGEGTVATLELPRA